MVSCVASKPSDQETFVPEVLLHKGGEMQDAGALTKCKNAVCFIYCNSEENIKRGTGIFCYVKVRGIDYKCIVTNNHVLSSKDDAARAVARFHYEGNMPGADAQLLPDILFYTNEVLDYTIIGCDHSRIEYTFCIEPVELAVEENLAVGDDVFIFQHPKGEAKKFSYQKVSSIDKPFLYYNADTDIGSSGSGVFHRFKLVAVHSKGSDSLQYNKGTLCSEIISHLNCGSYTIPRPLSESAFRLKRKSLSMDFAIDSDVADVPGSSNVIPPSPKKLCKRALEIFSQSDPLHQPSEECLQELSRDVVSYWKHLGRKLGLPNSKIESIQKDHHNYDDITEKAFAMLLAWRDLGVSSTLLALANALKALGKVDTAKKRFGL